MKNKIIYLLVFLIQIAWAQKTTKTKLAGFPAQEIAIYKTIDPNNLNASLYVGYSKAEVIAALGQGRIYRNDADDGVCVGYSDGLAVCYDDENLAGYYMLAIQKLDVGQNPYYIGEKYKLGIGSIFPKQILDEYEGEIYINGINGPPISPAEEPSWDAYFTRQYAFALITPQGNVSDANLAIDVGKSGVILKIYIGMSQ
jgi:hypothetical protein